MNDLELHNMLPDSMDDIRRLVRWLNFVSDHLDTMPTPFDDIVSIDGANASVEGARTGVERMRDVIADIRDRLIEYTQLIERMAEQRQSALDSYREGYKARYTDLVAELSGPEYVALRRALIDLEDDGKIPF